MRAMMPAVQADFLLFLSSSTSVNSASTTSSFAASLAASLSACCLYMASPSFIEACASVFDGAALAVTDLRAMFGQRLLGGMHQRVGMVLGVDRLAAFLVLGGVGLG